MTYENIYFTQPNIVKDKGNFYFLDYTSDLLVKKTSGGTYVTTYPVDIELRSISEESSVLGAVTSLEYDGFYFWSLQSYNDSTGIVVRVFKVRHDMCQLEREFIYRNDSSVVYNSSTISTIHYNTYLTAYSSKYSHSLYLNEFYNSKLNPGDLVYLGPTEDNMYEVIPVDSIETSGVHTRYGLSYNHYPDEEVTICNSFLILNNYDSSNSIGSIIKCNAITGDIESTSSDLEYYNITASVFYRFLGVFKDFPDVHALAYVKNNYIKVRKIQDLLDIYDAVGVSDDFNSPDYSLPDSYNWNVTEGNPYIFNNKLLMSTVSTGHDTITSKYSILSDFEVIVSCTNSGIFPYRGTSIYPKYDQYMLFDFKSDSYGIAYRYTEEPVYCDTTDSILIYRLFDNNTKDSSGNDFDGVASNVTYEEDVLGVSDNASVFTRTSSSSLVLQNDSILEVGKNNEDFSLIFWLKFNEGHTYAWYSITCKSSSSDTRTFAIWKLYGSNGLHCRISTTSNYNDGVNTSELTVGEWYLFSYIKKGNNLSIYLNKNLDQSITISDTVSNTGPVYIGKTPWYESASFSMDDYRLYSRALSVDEIGIIYDRKFSPQEAMSTHTEFISFKNGLVLSSYTVSSGLWLNDFDIKTTRQDNSLDFSFRPTYSGIPGDWVSLSSTAIPQSECLLSLGLHSILTTVSGVTFDNLLFSNGQVTYPNLEGAYYGSMIIDNIKTDNSTYIPIYDITVENNDVYRLQVGASYFGSDYNWSTYNYQLSTFRPFIDTVILEAYPVILPATGMNTTSLRAIIKDQYNNGVIGKNSYFSEDDPIGFISSKEVQTDLFFGTGTALSAYTSGLDVRAVTIKVLATQED